MNNVGVDVMSDEDGNDKSGLPDVNDGVDY